MRTEVYFNLRRKCFSVRRGGVVQAHASCILIHEPRFVDQEGGRQRVLREKRKNVHAFVVGEPDSIVTFPDHTRAGWDSTLTNHGWVHQVWYRPYLSGAFHAEDIRLSSTAQAFPISSAKWVWMVVIDGVPHMVAKEPTELIEP